MESEELRIFQKALLSRRHTLLQNLESLRTEALQKVTPDELGEISAIKIHPADLASETAQQERDLQTADIEENELIEIDAALLRIQGGDYGICQMCHEPISFKRLVAVPQARYCKRDQEVADQREHKH